MRRWRFGFLSVLAMGLFTLGALGVAHAAGPVKLKPVVIHATKKPGKPHPGLKKIQKSLQKTFGQYKGFTLVSKEVLQLEKGKASKLKLPKNRSALITYKGTKKKQHKLRLSVPKSKVNIDLSVKPRKMFYQAGLKHDGGILILGLYIKD